MRPPADCAAVECILQLAPAAQASAMFVPVSCIAFDSRARTVRGSRAGKPDKAILGSLFCCTAGGVAAACQPGGAQEGDASRCSSSRPAAHPAGDTPGRCHAAQVSHCLCRDVVNAIWLEEQSLIAHAFRCICVVLTVLSVSCCSRCAVNGAVTSLRVLREIAAAFVDINGQNSAQSLRSGPSAGITHCGNNNRFHASAVNLKCGARQPCKHMPSRAATGLFGRLLQGLGNTDSAAGPDSGHQRRSGGLWRAATAAAGSGGAADGNRRAGRRSRARRPADPRGRGVLKLSLGSLTKFTVALRWSLTVLGRIRRLSGGQVLFSASLSNPAALKAASRR